MFAKQISCTGAEFLSQGTGITRRRVQQQVVVTRTPHLCEETSATADVGVTWLGFLLGSSISCQIFVHTWLLKKQSVQLCTLLRAIHLQTGEFQQIRVVFHLCSLIAR